MRRKDNEFEVRIKAPTLGLVTRIPGEQPDVRSATRASNVRFANGTASAAPGYGVLVTDPVLTELPILVHQSPIQGLGKVFSPVVVGTSRRLYAMLRWASEPPIPSSSGGSEEEPPPAT